MQKKDTLKYITQSFRNGNVHDALDSWLQSYQYISIAELLECNVEWSTEELMQILITHRDMYDHVIQQIIKEKQNGNVY
jgi:hypothetical protein